MIRLLHAYFPSRTLFLGVSEACLISLAFLTATLARLGAGGAGRVFNYQHGSLKILVMSIAIVICMHYFDLYDTSILSNRREVLIRLTQALGTVYSLSVLVYFLYPPLELGRGIFVIGLLFAAMLLFFWRGLFSKINSVPEFADRALIFGEGPLAELLETEFESRPELGLRVVGRVLPSSNGTGNHHGGYEPVEFVGDSSHDQIWLMIFRALSKIFAQPASSLPWATDVASFLSTCCFHSSVVDCESRMELKSMKRSREKSRLNPFARAGCFSRPDVMLPAFILCTSESHPSWFLSLAYY